MSSSHLKYSKCAPLSRREKCLKTDIKPENLQEEFSFVLPQKLIDGRYLVLRWPNEKCPDECPEFHYPLNTSCVTVGCATYIFQVICPECSLHIYILPALQDRLELQMRLSSKRVSCADSR